MNMRHNLIMIIMRLEMNMYDGKHINFGINDFWSCTKI